MRRIKKLTESDLHNIVRKSVNRILNEAESGGWVVETDEAQEAYEMAVDKLGEEYVNSAIVRCMGDKVLSQCLAYLFRQWDFREWENR